MELDDLKTKWQELDKRLDKMNEKTEKLAMEVITGKFTSAKQRLIRITCSGIFLLTILPFYVLRIHHSTLTSLETTCLVLFSLFIFTMLARQIVLLALLGQIKPEKQSVCETCAAVLRFRRWFLVGTALGIGLGVPLCIVFGLYVSKMITPYMLYGFITGLVIGLPLGINIFLRAWRDVRTMQTTLQDI